MELKQWQTYFIDKYPANGQTIISEQNISFKYILTDMHSEVLTEEQRKLLPLIRSFSNDYYLVGGTAIALHIGHRRSIDFDLFTTQDIKRKSIRNLIDKSGFTVALGGRAKWKGYVDLYFILKDRHDLRELSARAVEIFGAYFNEKLFREQLCFFDDIDYSEKVEYIGDEINEGEIRKFLVDIAMTRFI